MSSLIWLLPALTRMSITAPCSGGTQGMIFTQKWDTTPHICSRLLPTAASMPFLGCLVLKVGSFPGSVFGSCPSWPVTTCNILPGWPLGPPSQTPLQEVEQTLGECVSPQPPPTDEENFLSFSLSRDGAAFPTDRRWDAISSQQEKQSMCKL